MIEGAAFLPMWSKAAKSIALPEAAKLLADLIERRVAKVRQGVK
ncbi:hypothetical protein ABI_11220 [Asticcacaulis biprosthecium C19]|uniref:Uncharacterized protein n=1 Tax=Asticcacaulis biprosthecium C19 TaxID=715226 RepID=F4QHE8_9CAUL|nr:hypothetical protein [Asticcacaulis biprosthecium]EGF92685.1 hypothetical protein ABI_11220 [Asticcacaulis biprosthecium C19]